jgi:alpha-beta hydrolase superfamily lysophospholipase
MPTFAARDGIELFERVWPTANGEAKAVVVLQHGYGEHIERYDHVARAWNARGFHVVGSDLRGHGRSGGPRGFCSRFSEYLDDLDGLIARAKAAHPGKPLFLVGHSFGGLITTHHVLERGGGGARGFMLSSPFFELALKVSRVKIWAALAMSSVYPRMALPSGLRGVDVTRDPELSALYDRDPLNNKNATARWFTETSQAQAEARARASQIKLPCLVMHGGADRVAAPDASRAIFSGISATDKSLRVLEGQYHEIFNEPLADRERTIAEVGEWLERHASA